jgi:hypothetical protein|tara:strand:- start:1488 stop:1661 length:174 start_codon:yes stop_codon:yes gene_type:complete
MDDKEKILRWDLNEAIKEQNQPYMDGLLASGKFAVMKHREEKVSKCRKELNLYLKDG